MNRAEVWQEPWGSRRWIVATHTQPLYVRHKKRIVDRPDHYIERERPFPTHAEALETALAWVGLTTPPEHKEPS